MSHATGAQPPTQPAANPFSASEPWNLVADGYAEFWDNMVKGSAPIQMMKKSIMSVRGEPVEPHSNTTGEELWREKEKLALAWLEETLPTLKRPLTSEVWLGGGGEVMQRNQPI